MAKTQTKTKTKSKAKTKTKAKTKSNKTLVVVESPAKAKTINKYLGRNYIVEASVGHIKDLVKFRLGVDVENDFQPKYVTIRGKADVIKKLKSLAKESKDVLIATDPDREGEAIAWHLAEEVAKTNEDVKRVIFNEITKTGIKKGLEDKKLINNDLFMSQQARRVLDRLIGYKVSPFLSRAMLEKTSQSLSAGRVQSVALRLICEREHEIDIFKPIEYWSIAGNFLYDDQNIIKTRLVAFDGNNIKNPEGSAFSEDKLEQSKINNNLKNLHYIKNEDQAKDLLKRIKDQDYSINSIAKKTVRRKPQAPFTTSLLQQDASRRLGFSNKKTMMIAQKLYEGVSIGSKGAVGLITYMRTDSVRVSPEAEQSAREHISDSYGKNYIPSKPPVYSSKSSNIQDAHEAIRPTSMELKPGEVRNHLSKDEALLYELIYNRFIASQMKPAELEQTTISIKSDDFEFRASGSVMIFDGFLRVYADYVDDSKKKDSNSLLPGGLKENQEMKLDKAIKNQSFTKAPPRFTEASLVKELDEIGIGRPSTYSQIISTLLDRDYVDLVKKSFTPTELGKDVNVILIKHFPDLFNVDFTAEMEKELDIIAEGGKTYESVIKNFYSPFTKSLEHAEKNADFPEIPCPKCGAPMVIRVSRRGRFMGCSRYPDCTGTQPLPKSDKEKKEPVKAEGEICEKCGGQMYIREGRYGRFLGCENYPECKNIKPLSTGIKCPKCENGTLVEKFSPKSRKKFWGCSAYPDCDQISKYEPVKRDCPSCGNHYIEIRFKKVSDGYEKYLACPKCKEKFDYDLDDSEK